MQSLFEEKLATQKEALLQGKQLADIIAGDGGEAGVGGGIESGRPGASVRRRRAP